MTLTRKLALRISNGVVRWASPARKEWAEGLAREVAFIESDWAALGWSLGSTRVIFDRPEAPIGSLDEVPAQFQKFADRFMYWEALGLWAPIASGPIFAFVLFLARVENARFGSAFIVFASICGLIFWLVERHRLKLQLTGDVPNNVVACALNYEAALKRQCAAIWIPAFVIVSFWIGLAELQGGFRAYPFFSSGYIVIAISDVLRLRIMQRIYERRIERLDVLLAERSEAISIDGVN